jgi:cell division protein FtsL
MSLTAKLILCLLFVLGLCAISVAYWREKPRRVLDTPNPPRVPESLHETANALYLRRNARRRSP